MAGIKISGLGRSSSQVGQELVFSASNLGTTSTIVLFTCPQGKRYAVVGWSVRYGTATSVSGGVVSLERVPSGTALGSGTDIKTTGAAADGTANTVYYGVPDDTEGSSGKNIVEPGESLRILYVGNSGTLTSFALAHVTVIVREIPPYKGS